MSRQDRLKDYAAMKGPAGEGRDQKNLDYWADRATANSQCASRASRAMDLPSTGKKMATRDTAMGQFEPRSVNARMAGKADKNHAGSNYMPNVRRQS